MCSMFIIINGSEQMTKVILKYLTFQLSSASPCSSEGESLDEGGLDFDFLPLEEVRLDGLEDVLLEARLSRVF